MVAEGQFHRIFDAASGVTSVYIWSADENKSYRVTPAMSADQSDLGPVGRLSVFPEQSRVCPADLEFRI